ncbi:MAG TPA: hypothetical protein VIG25_13970 [Pyrinomonadaceae bacterium]|jgi:hypothetical protein
MKTEKTIDYVRSLREEIAALCVVKCHMSHERIRRAGESMLPVVCRSPEGGYQRFGLCSREVRAQRLGCSHSTARIKLERAINELNAGGGGCCGQTPSLGSELNWLNNEIHLLDHRKGEAEKALARIEEEIHRAGDRAHGREASVEARKVVLEMERLHDEYVERIGVLRDRVVNELDRLSEQGKRSQQCLEQP